MCATHEFSPLVGSFFYHLTPNCSLPLLFTASKGQIQLNKIVALLISVTKGCCYLPEFLLIAYCLLCVSVCGFRLPALPSLSLLQDKYTRDKDREKLEKSHKRFEM
jgi:hypothetical protein